MKLLKALVISFSMYSGIPMPQFEWKEEDMKYMLCFFPWIGAVIGLGIVLWSMLCKQAELGMLCYTTVSYTHLYYQQSMSVGDLMKDFHIMLLRGDDTQMKYLFRLK